MRILALACVLLWACDDETGFVDATVLTTTRTDASVSADADADEGQDASTGTDTSVNDDSLTTGDAGDDDADVSDDADAVEVDTSPPLDPNGDTDKDGIMDLDEVAAGTDPFDPRSAATWHPEITGHPRLFVDAADRATIRARAEATDGSSKALWDRVVSTAAQTPPAHGATFDTSVSSPQGRIAEANALIAWAKEDVVAGTKALEILATPFPDPTPLNEQSSFNAGDHYDLLEAEGLVPMCSAWDLLAGDAARYDATLLADAEANLVKRIDYFRVLCLERGGCKQLLRGEPNNHAMKAVAALALCAMALPERATAAIDFNEGVASMRWIIEEAQGNLEGGWAESWNYLSYSGESHLAFLLAWHHLADGATWTIRGTGTPTWRETTATKGKLQQIRDFAFNPTLTAVYRAALIATQPDGRTPPVDDANVSALHGGALAALFDDGRFLWNWDNVGRSTGQVLVPTFLALDPTLAPVGPDWDRDQFFVDAGFSVLKSDFGPQALYLLVQHEQGRMRKLGGAHEHADPLSFIIHAFGQPLAIDPGYIDFSNHGKVKYGKDHNIVLVDGAGPEFFLDGIVDTAPNSDGYLHSNEIAGAVYTSLATSTKYANAEIRRRFVRVDQRAIVVADALVADDAHTYTWQLNGYASEQMANTSFERDPSAPNGASIATWSRGNVDLIAVVAATEGTTSASDRLEESLNVDGNKQHRCLAFDAAMNQKAGFVALLVPTQVDLGEVDGGQGPAGTAWVSVGMDAAVLNRNAIASKVMVAGTEYTVEPGLTMVDLILGPTVHFTMDMPAIPDPEPFIPE